MNPVSPSVTVIIPVYNRNSELKRAINSVLTQSYGNFELIIVDDGSTACSIQTIVEKFGDPRITLLINRVNKGVSYARNRAIKTARADLIAFLDSDDEWKKKKLEKQIGFLQNHRELRVVHTEEIWIRRGKRVNQKKHHRKSGGDIFTRSLGLCLMSPSSIMLKKEVFDDYGLFDEELVVCEDYDLWLRITAYEKVGFIEEPLIIKYGGHQDQLSTAYEAMDKFRITSLLKLYFSEHHLTREKQQALREMIITKTTILLGGARKREKIEDIEKYEAILNKISQ